MRSIIDKIRNRVRVRHKALVGFQEIYEKTVPLLRSDIEQFGEALEALGAVKQILDEIQGEMATGLGHLAEGGELLEELVDGHAHDATLVVNLVEVFMKSDYKVLAQTLEVVSDEARLEALRSLSRQGREKILADLKQIEGDG